MIDRLMMMDESRLALNLDMIDADQKDVGTMTWYSVFSSC